MLCSNASTADSTFPKLTGRCEPDRSPSSAPTPPEPTANPCAATACVVEGPGGCRPCHRSSPRAPRTTPDTGDTEPERADPAHRGPRRAAATRGCQLRVGSGALRPGDAPERRVTFHVTAERGARPWPPSAPCWHSTPWSSAVGSTRSACASRRSGRSPTLPSLLPSVSCSPCSQTGASGAVLQRLRRREEPVGGQPLRVRSDHRGPSQSRPPNSPRSSSRSASCLRSASARSSSRSEPPRWTPSRSPSCCSASP